MYKSENPAKAFVVVRLFVTPWTTACQAPSPSPSLVTCSNSLSSLSQWCHPRPLPLLSPSPPAFNLSQHQGLFQFVSSSNGQSMEASVSASVLPTNIQSWFPLGLTGLISLQFKGISRFFSNTTVQKHQFFKAQPSLWSISHPYMNNCWKTIALTRWTLVNRIIALLFSTLCRFIIAFLPRSKCLSVSWYSHHLQWFWSPRKHCFHCFPSICREVMGLEALILVF